MRNSLINDMKNDTEMYESMEMTQEEKDIFLANLKSRTKCEKRSKGSAMRTAGAVAAAFAVVSLLLLGNGVVKAGGIKEFAEQIGVTEVIEKIGWKKADVNEVAWDGTEDSTIEVDKIDEVVEGNKYDVNLQQFYMDALGQGIVSFAIQKKEGVTDKISLGNVWFGVIERNEVDGAVEYRYIYYSPNIDFDKENMTLIECIWDSEAVGKDFFVKIGDELFEFGNMGIQGKSYWKWALEDGEIRLGVLGFEMKESCEMNRYLCKYDPDREGILTYKDGRQIPVAGRMQLRDSKDGMVYRDLQYDYMSNGGSSLTWTNYHKNILIDIENLESIQFGDYILYTKDAELVTVE